MKTSEFLDLLEQHSDKELSFEYAKGQAVPSDYHITEIKNITIDSVDCGANPHFERRTEVQLWTPGGQDHQPRLKAGKAGAIFSRVDQVKPMDRDAEIYFEFGHAALATSSYRVEFAHADEARLNVFLSVPPVACKPRLLETEASSKTCC